MFIKYAQLASDEHVEALSMNCELIVANGREQQWRELVAETRIMYNGLITESANWGPWPGDQVKWWDALDFIGVDAYFPLSAKTVPDLVYEWIPILDKLQGLAQSINKQIAFTEIGYPVGTGLRDYHPTQADYDLQKIKYEAVVDATKSLGWFLGVFWWNWETDAGYAPGDDCFTPQWKPAVNVLRDYYNTTMPPPVYPQFIATCYGFGKCTS